MPALSLRLVVATFRRVWQRPAFALAATATLALGIAAPTALFAVLDATLLRPLPYPDSGSIYTVRTRMVDGRYTIGLVGSEELGDLRRFSPQVIRAATMLRQDQTLERDDEARQVTCEYVSREFFDLFGLPMAVGRPFNADDYKAPMGTRVVLSDRAWRSVFAGDRAIVNTTIRIGGASALVVGVAPPAFAMPREADVWLPDPMPENVGHTYEGIVRVAPGVTPDTLNARLGPMWDALAQKYPDQDRGRVFTMTSLLDAIVGDLGPIVILAFAATGVLLVIAVVNVANLWLARAARQARDVAIRTALGATRGRLARQLIGESLVVAGTAAVAGVALAVLAVRVIVLVGGRALPRVDGLHVDPLALGFAALLMILTGVVVGLAPVLTMARPNLLAITNEGGRSGIAGRTTRRTLAAMIVVEVALAIALVAGAGRLVVSMRHLLAIDPNFQVDGHLAVDVLLPFNPYRDPARTFAWEDDATRVIRSAGASDVALASTLPFRHEWDSTTFVDITGHPTDPAHRPNGRLRMVSTNFFDVMRMPIVAGRAFNADDRFNGSPVVIVNEAWVRRFIPDLDPLQVRVNPGTFTTRDANGQFVRHDAPIVGVARDAPYSDLTKAAEPTVFVALTQVRTPRMTLIVTAPDGHPERLTTSIRTGLAKVDSRVPVDVELLSHAVDASLVWPKLGLLLMTTFGGAALLLAATGVFGVIAFVTTERQAEMAVRLALGGSTAHVFGLVVRSGITLALEGAVVGLLLAWWVGRLMARYTYQVSAGSPVVLTGSALAVLVVALVATLPSARRAATTSPAGFRQ